MKKLNIIILVLSLALVFAIFYNTLDVSANNDIALAESDNKDLATDPALINNIKYKQKGNDPVLSVMVAGPSESAFAWSGSLLEGFSYNNTSLIENLMANSNANLYVSFIKDNSVCLIEQDEYVYNNDFNANTADVEILDSAKLSKHSIIIVQFSEVELSMQKLYNQFEAIIVEVLNKYIQSGAQMPTVNLIGHGLGGMLNIMFANNFPNTVYSVFNIGTPHLGIDG